MSLKDAQQKSLHILKLIFWVNFRGGIEEEMYPYSKQSCHSFLKYMRFTWEQSVIKTWNGGL